MATDLRALGAELQGLRGESGLSILDMADILGVTPAHVRSIECGERGPTLTELARWGIALAIGTERLAELARMAGLATADDEEGAVADRAADAYAEGHGCIPPEASRRIANCRWSMADCLAEPKRPFPIYVCMKNERRPEICRLLRGHRVCLARRAWWGPERVD